MAGNVITYLDNMREEIPPEILSPENYLRLHKMAAFFQDIAASKYGLETHLDTAVPFVDFSFRVLDAEKESLGQALHRSILPQAGENEVWKRLTDFIACWSRDHEPVNRKVRNVWFELDHEQAENEIPEPCLFFDAAQISRGFSAAEADEYFWWSKTALGSLLGDRRVRLLQPGLRQAVSFLPPGQDLHRGVMMYTGVMLSRNKDRIRISTVPLTSEQIGDYLRKIAWPGSYAEIEKMFLLADDFCRPYYNLGFDVTADGIAEKVSIEIRPRNYKALPAFLENLAAKNLCTDVKRKGVLSWRGASYKYLGRDYGQTLIIKDISHFKVSCEPGKGLRVKAYLRIAGIYLKELF